MPVVCRAPRVFRPENATGGGYSVPDSTHLNRAGDEPCAMVEIAAAIARHIVRHAGDERTMERGEVRFRVGERYPHSTISVTVRARDSRARATSTE